MDGWTHRWGVGQSVEEEDWLIYSGGDQKKAEKSFGRSIWFVGGRSDDFFLLESM